MQASEKKERIAKDRSFLVDENIRNGVLHGVPGYYVPVRLTSYRSLPLSCIEKIELKINDEPIENSRIKFVLNGYSNSLYKLKTLSHIWWFILDYADLFVESSTPLETGEYNVDALLVTVEPYVTGGRFSFFYPSQKTLRVEAAY